MKLLIILLCAFSALGASLSDYCTPNAALDDSACFQTLVDDMPEGGTIFIDEGIWNIEDTINFVPTTPANSFIVQGTKNSIIKPSLTGILFYSGNQNQIDFRDLIIVGDGTTDADFSYGIFGGWSSHVRIIGCQFIGLKATHSIVFIGNADGVIKDSLFHGNSSEANVEASEARGLTVTDTEFLDYGSLNGVYYSKTPLGNGAWIRSTSPSFSTPNAMANRGVTISNVRLDEGALYSVELQNIRYASFYNLSVNVTAFTGGAGIVLDNVKYAEVKMSQFGYSTEERPAIRAINNSTVFIESMTVGNGVFYGERDQGSQSFFNLKACSSGCFFNVL